jgi:putative intracellular protease/amidase
MLVMRTLRHVAVLSSALVLLGAVGFAAWLYSLPPMPPAASPASVPEEETRAATTALAQPRRPRPLVAIIGINDATETTDYLMPYGILRRADVADVVALATSAGPMRLYPALKVQPQATIAQFDARHPQGADYVIVPAMSRDDDPAAIRWIRAQAAKGATVIGVCAGAKVVASAGLLDGRRATTHWYYLDGMLARHPSIRHAPDRRFVIDRGVATTTGVTASMPMTLTLVEAIAGRTKAQEVAHDLGLPHWDARHDSSAFVFNRAFALTALGNRLAFWKHEQLGLELAPGVEANGRRPVDPARPHRRGLAGAPALARHRKAQAGAGAGPNAAGYSPPLWRRYGPLRRHAARVSRSGAALGATSIVRVLASASTPISRACDGWSCLLSDHAETRKSARCARKSPIALRAIAPFFKGGCRSLSKGAADCCDGSVEPCDSSALRFSPFEKGGHRGICFCL